MVRSKLSSDDGHDDQFEIIDYTIASEWETLISKLENLILKLTKPTKNKEDVSSSDASVQFNGHTYQFIYRSPNDNNNNNNNSNQDNKRKVKKIDKPNCFMDAKNDFLMFSTYNPFVEGNNSSHSLARYHQVENFSNWFGVSRYFLLLALKDSGPEISELSTILSAFTVALHNANCTNIPGFVGFDEKRLENFLGYMYAPLSRKSDHCFTVKFATESINVQSLNIHQNISESIEKQLKIFYSKLSIDPDDRNWEQFLSLTTISTKYTYVRSDWDEIDWRYIDIEEEENEDQEKKEKDELNESMEEEEDNEDQNPKILTTSLSFGWGYPMDPIEQLQFCVMYPPLKSIHILEDEISSMESKSWYIKSVFRKPHPSLFQMSNGVSNIFNAMNESLKSKSIYQVLSDYNIRNNFTMSNQERHSPNLMSQQQQQQQTFKKNYQPSDNEQQLQQQQLNQQQPQSLMKTMGSLTKTLTTSLNSPVIPTNREIDMVLRDLFFNNKNSKDPKHFNNIPEDLLNSYLPNVKNSLYKRTPIDSLFFSFCFVCLNLSSLVGILIFWTEFVGEIKWHWENSVPIPRTFTSSNINMNNCLIYQKLQMINYCILRKNNRSNLNSSKSIKKEQPKQKQQKVSSKDGWDDEDDDIESDDDEEVVEPTKGQQQQKDQLKKLDGQYLLYADKEIVVPKTQEFGPMTDDMVHEQLEELVKLGDSEEANEARLKMQIPSLLSDMQAFKHANKGCVFEDFIRWHSSRDWIIGKKEIKPKEQLQQPKKQIEVVESEEEEEKEEEQSKNDQEEEEEEEIEGQIKIKDTKKQNTMADSLDVIVEEFGIVEDEVMVDESNGRTRGFGYGRDGYLSERMDRKNVWRKTWVEADPIEMDDQHPIFDYIKQAEKAIQYFETIHPSDLLYQITSVLLSSIAVIFSTEKSSTTHLPNEYCLGLSYPHTKQLIEKYLENLNSSWPLNIPKEIKKNEFDQLFKSIQEIENSISKLTSLKSKFQKMDRIINNLYNQGYSDIKEDEHSLVSQLIFEADEDASTVKPSIKEYITRSYAPRPFRDSQMMPHRMYTCLSPYECRISTIISEEDQY